MSEGPNSRRPTKRNDPRALSRFVQELSWLLNSYADLDFRALESLAIRSQAPSPSQVPKRKTKLGKRHNVEALIGVLPGLFVDERLFPSNEDIAEFAVAALGVNIPRWQKKSKFELVGHIVCTANALDDNAVSLLVDALRSVTGEQIVRNQLEDQRQRGLSWNEVIQNLISSRNG